MVGMETKVKALGKEWTFSHRVEWGTVKAFFAWVREQEGDVFADFERFVNYIPEADRAGIFRERQARRDQLRSLNLGSPIAQEYKQTMEGIGFLAAAALRVKHPDITTEEAFLVMQELDPKVAADIARRTEAINKSLLKNEPAPAA